MKRTSIKSSEYKLAHTPVAELRYKLSQPGVELRSMICYHVESKCNRRRFTPGAPTSMIPTATAAAALLLLPPSASVNRGSYSPLLSSSVPHSSSFGPFRALGVLRVSPSQIGNSRLHFRPPNALVPYHSGATFDPELRLVLDLATDEELIEIEHILYGPSYFSPLLKSITGRRDADYIVYGEFIEEREDFIDYLESRFLYLAADARSTLRGWRPSYRNVLLRVRRKLGVPCSSKLSTEDLEVEIFLHLLSASELKDTISFPSSEKPSKKGRNLEIGHSPMKLHVLSALKAGAEELQQTICKGFGTLTVTRIYQLLARKLSGQMLLEAANYEVVHELRKRGGSLVAVTLESKVAELAAKQGLASAASRYIGLRSLMAFLGPVMWGTFLADVVIRMLGTDYARILRAIYAFAQIRLNRTHGWR